MEDNELRQKLDTIEAKIADVYVSAEKTRKYFLVILWVTVIAIVLPLIGLVFAIPAFLNNYVGALNGLGI